MPSAPVCGLVESAVRADLAKLDDPPAGLAAAALVLARALDDGAGMATAAVARELRATLAALQPPDEEATDADTARLHDLMARLSKPA